MTIYISAVLLAQLAQAPEIQARQGMLHGLDICEPLEMTPYERQTALEAAITAAGIDGSNYALLDKTSPSNPKADNVPEGLRAKVLEFPQFFGAYPIENAGITLICRKGGEDSATYFLAEGLQEPTYIITAEEALRAPQERSGNCKLEGPNPAYRLRDKQFSLSYAVSCPLERLLINAKTGLIEQAQPRILR